MTSSPHSEQAMHTVPFCVVALFSTNLDRSQFAWPILDAGVLGVFFFFILLHSSRYILVHILCPSLGITCTFRLMSV